MSVRLRAEGVRVRPGRSASFELHVPALELHGAQTLAVLGPNGAGKSTLLKTLAGLEPLVEGHIERGPAPTMVFQRPVVLSGSVAHNVRVALWGHGLTRPGLTSRVGQELERFGIAHLAWRPAATLSGGELRRLALARAFVVHSPVLLLDEPFDDLDADGQEQLSLDLTREIRETGVAVAMVTHDLPRALLLADRLAVLLEGRLVQCGARDEVLRRPATRGVAALVGMRNLVEGRVEARLPEGCVRVRVDPDHAVVARADRGVGERALVGLRPEHVKVDVGRGEGESIGKGIVEHVLSDGLLVVVTIAWAGLRLRTHLLAGRGLGHSLAAGDAVSLRVRPDDVHLLPSD
jgi:ABC-type sulfate/molybdate transport systems ATPase subunit